jgi:hypothetical protein
MKIGTMLATAVFVLASFPLMAQQQPPSEQPNSPVPQNPPGATSAPPSTPAAVPENPSATVPETTAAAPPETTAASMSPVNGELVSKLDSKTAKTGDSIVVQTNASVKTADGTEIPKGSKLVGQVLAVQASAAGENSQVVLQFDHAELKSGQNVAIHSQIQSIAPAAGDASSASAPMAAPPASASSTDPASMAGRTPGNAMPGSGSAPPTPAAAAGGDPAPGTIVARNGNIAIQTTSIPGVLLANNAPGQVDPRMAKASSILLGAKKDIQLDGGTKMVLGVSAAGGGAQSQ